MFALGKVLLGDMSGGLFGLAIHFWVVSSHIPLLKKRQIVVIRV